MANTINNYFTTIGPSLAANMNDPRVYAGPNINHVLNDTFHVNTDELLKILGDIDCTKSSAIDHVNSKVLKDALICLVDQFKYLLNLSFRTGVFPEDWKKAQITPLPKDGDLTNCNNYRPISLLPLPGKIAKKIAHNKLMDYFENNELLNKKQGGFRKKNSTINSISEFTHEIFRAINNKHISLATFIDFSKAFDTVNHIILLEKLKIYGIKNNNFQWIQNYLTNRQQSTIVNGTVSNPLKINCGVP